MKARGKRLTGWSILIGIILLSLGMSLYFLGPIMTAVLLAFGYIANAIFPPIFKKVGDLVCSDDEPEIITE